jgi:hypothetical protein
MKAQKMPNKHYFNFPIIPLNHTLHVFFGGEMKDIKETLGGIVNKRELNDFLRLECYAKFGVFSCADAVIWLPCVPTTPYHFGALSHEIQHIVYHVLDICGIKHCEKTDEIFSYHTGNITEMIHIAIADIKDAENIETCTQQQ